MQVITNLDLFVKPNYAVVTQGTFDGVHSGHVQILKNIVDLARAKYGKSILVTFYPHPRQVLFKDKGSLKLLTSMDEKISLFSEIGLDYLIIIPFDDTFSKMPALNFVRDILVEKIGVNTMVVGYDHRFGKNREASFDDLKDFSELYGFDVLEIAPHDVSEAIVSSTKIRNNLSEGNVELANLYLERPYSLKGKVVHGKKLGRQIGYPTANIAPLDEDKLIPANGVYAVKVRIRGQEYSGMLNIGNNPTIENAKWSIEVNIFDFDELIYDEEIIVYFLHRMRDEVKFENLEELKKQLALDKIKAEGLLG